MGCAWTWLGQSRVEGTRDLPSRWHAAVGLLRSPAQTWCSRYGTTILAPVKLCALVSPVVGTPSSPSCLAGNPGMS